MRVLDATLVGFILISLTFLGMLFLLIDIPMLNYVDPFLLEMVVLSMFLGLAFGLIAGHWYTKAQLKILLEKNEIKGLGSRRMYYALFSGFAMFLICSFFVFYYKSVVLGDSLVTFVISATFTTYLIRLILISSWEKRVRKIVMMGMNRIYIISKK